MTELNTSQMHLIASLFAYTSETLVLSTLQGHMGRGWVDDPGSPRAARILIGDFLFLAGDAEAPGARELVAHLPPDKSVPAVLAIPEHAGWSRLIQATWPEQHRAHITRYAFKKEPGCFDPQALRTFAANLASGYIIRPIDRDLYHRTLTLPFEADLCINFRDADDFLSRGIGFVALQGDAIVGGASSYTIYDSGIEIEIDVHPDHQRKGIATALGATLILACEARGLYPSWDAANLESVGLAEKLGYHLDTPYDCYVILYGDDLQV